MPHSQMQTLMGPSSCSLHFIDRERWNALVGELSSPKHVLFEGFLDEMDSKEQLLRLVAASMDFPGYFGGNWDAVEECLRDLSWRPADGYVLVLHSAERAWKRNPRALADLVESWMFAAAEWAREGIGFHLVFTW